MMNERMAMMPTDYTQLYVSSEVRFYTASDLMKLTGWSETIVLKLFNDPDFPSADFGRAKIVEAHALIDYFSRKRTKHKEVYWKKGEISDDVKKRLLRKC